MRTSGRVPDDSQRLGVLLAIFDFPMLSAGYRAVIDAQPDMAVVGEVVERGAVTEQLERLAADVVVTETLPFGRAIRAAEAIEAIRAARPGTKILALECRLSSEQFALALKAGADGFLTREAQAAEVVDAIRCVSHGETYVSPAIVTRMVNTYVLRTSPATLEDAYDTLSEREREVLLLAAVGHTNREIARTFHLSEQTVHNYRARIMEKLGFHDRVDLLKFAIRRGVIEVDSL